MECTCCELSPGSPDMRRLRWESMLTLGNETPLPARMNSCEAPLLLPIDEDDSCLEAWRRMCMGGTCWPLSPGNDGMRSTRECTATEKPSVGLLGSLETSRCSVSPGKDGMRSALECTATEKLLVSEPPKPRKLPIFCPQPMVDVMM